jgi:hypothetical protein
MFATGNLKLRKKHINQPLGLDINICRLQIFTYFFGLTLILWFPGKGPSNSKFGRGEPQNTNFPFDYLQVVTNPHKCIIKHIK